MNVTFLCFPEGKEYTIAELESHLGFEYLPQIVFETVEEQQEIRLRGLEKYQRGEVNAEAEALGNKFAQEIATAYLPSVSIRWLSVALRFGLFLEEDIAEGSFVGEYTGIVRANDLRRYFAPLNDYLYTYPVSDEIGRNFVIDATKGNPTRFINHSSHPNLKPIHVFYEGFYHLIFLALRPIEKGTQLCYDYGHNYWHLRGRPVDLIS